MTNEKFISLIQKQEIYAKKNPKSYVTKIKLLSILGIAYIYGILLIVLALSGYGTYAVIHYHVSKYTIKWLLAGAVAMIYGVYKAATFKTEPPTGVELTENSYAELFHMIEKMRIELDVPPLQKIILDNEFNACIISIPKYGFFGGYQHYVVVGLPLLMTLSTEELQGVIAHEMAHLSRSHGILGAWTYRVQSQYGILLDYFEEKQSFLQHIFKGFLKWYQPFYSAYSFVHRREQEYEADALAASIASSKNMASSLSSISSYAKQVEDDYWTITSEKMKTQNEPPQDIYHQMHEYIKGIPSHTLQENLEKALQEKTGYTDSHPCMLDRIAALSEVAMTREVHQDSIHLLGDRKENAFEYLENQWYQNIYLKWREGYEAFQTSKKDLETLSTKKATTFLTAEEYTSLVQAHGDWSSDEEYFEITEEFVSTYPQEALAQFWFGVELANQERLEALQYLKTSVTLNKKFIDAAVDQGYILCMKLKNEKAYNEFIMDIKKTL